MPGGRDSRGSDQQKSVALRICRDIMQTSRNKPVNSKKGETMKYTNNSNVKNGVTFRKAEGSANRYLAKKRFERKQERLDQLFFIVAGVYVPVLFIAMVFISRGSL